MLHMHMPVGCKKLCSQRTEMMITLMLPLSAGTAVGGPRADTHGSYPCLLPSTVDISMCSPALCFSGTDVPLSSFSILPVLAHFSHLSLKLSGWISVGKPPWLTVGGRAAGEVARETKQVTSWWAFKFWGHENSSLEKDKAQVF